MKNYNLRWWALILYLLIFLLAFAASGNAKDCRIFVVERAKSDNKFNTDAINVIKSKGYTPVRASNLNQLEANIVQAMNNQGCDCIRDLVIVGHGYNGTIKVGCGLRPHLERKPCEDNEYISSSNKDQWDTIFMTLEGHMCEHTLQSEGIFLYGCSTGVCHDGAQMLHDIAKLTGANVFAPTENVNGKDLFDNMLKLQDKWQYGVPSDKQPRDCKIGNDIYPRSRRRTARNEYYCPCDKALHEGLQDCTNQCQVSLSCYSGICDAVWVNNTADKYTANPILQGGTSTSALALAGFSVASYDQWGKGYNTGSVIEGSAGKGVSKLTGATLATTAWDEYGISQPAILKDGAMYWMWFAGYDSSDTARIGCASSTDGLNWTKDAGNPVLKEGPAGSWDETQVYNPTVIKDGSIFKMWYTGYSKTAKHARIGYATSPDGRTWTKHPTYVLDVGASSTWDEDGVGECSVIKDGGTYRMWYGGSDAGQWWRTGYATSTDGIVWIKYSGNPVVSEGAAGAWDEWAASAPEVIKDGNRYQMLYGGIDAYNIARIGHATSSDGMNWTKSTQNPLMTESVGSEWDNHDIFHPAFFKDKNEDLFKIFYRGYSGDNYEYAMGYAVATHLGCQMLGNDLSLTINCFKYLGQRYTFKLKLYQNPDDPTGIYWKMDMTTLAVSSGGDCITLGSDLSLTINCAEYSGKRYAFTLNLYNNPRDPAGIYWKMDINSIQ